MLNQAQSTKWNVKHCFCDSSTEQDQQNRTICDSLRQLYFTRNLLLDFNNLKQICF